MAAIAQPSATMDMGSTPRRPVGAAPRLVCICTSASPEDAELAQH